MKSIEELKDLKNKVVHSLSESEEFIEEELIDEMYIAAYPALLSHSGEPINDPSGKANNNKIQVMFRRNEDTYKLDNMYVSLNSDNGNINEHYEICENDNKCILNPISVDEIKKDGLCNTYIIENSSDKLSIKKDYSNLMDKLSKNSGIDFSLFQNKLHSDNKSEYTKVNYLLNLLKEFNIKIFNDENIN